MTTLTTPEKSDAADQPASQSDSSCESAKTKESKFRFDLANLLNRYNKESQSNTPDFILASYLIASLTAFNAAVKARADWYKEDDFK